MKEVFCPKCDQNFPEDAVCDHYKALNFKPGENPDFFIRMISNPPKPKWNGKRLLSAYCVSNNFLKSLPYRGKRVDCK